MLDHADRDAILAHAQDDLARLFDDLGGQRRGKSLRCPAGTHADKSPSASIKDGRLRCFSCGFSADAIALTEAMLGTDFRGALQYLSDRYGVPLNRPLTAEEIAEAERIEREADKRAADIAAWAVGAASAWCVEWESWRELWEICVARELNGGVENIHHLAGPIRSKLATMRAGYPRDIAALYASELAADPRETARLTMNGYALLAGVESIANLVISEMQRWAA